jgi:hypothetical protein
MYPADRLFPFSTDPDFFTFDDLPDELEFNGSIWPKTIELFSGGGTSACWKLYQSPDDEEDMILWNVDENEYGTLGCVDGDGPNYNTQQSFGIACCLIDLDFQDQFADTYTVTWPGGFDGALVPISVIVTRVSQCVWQGVDPCGNPIYLFYGDNVDIGGGIDYSWNLSLNSYILEPCLLEFTYIIRKDPVPPSYQNAPIGYYIETYATDATVS